MPLDVLPIIHPGALELRVIKLETKRLDQMKRGAGGGAKPGNVTGVRRNLRFNEDKVHVFNIQ